MTSIKALRPTNRHLTIVPHFNKEKETDVLLPEDFKRPTSAYVKATVIDIASDCSDDFRQLRYAGTESPEIVVQRSMIEEIAIDGKTHYMVLENYVMGIYRRPTIQ